jgi:hypothetical protein
MDACNMDGKREEGWEGGFKEGRSGSLMQRARARAEQDDDDDDDAECDWRLSQEYHCACNSAG